ncbi:MAG: glycosyltransferase [Rhodospirillaceae bacterium]|nr:glycosyltransferase [Rhodospirillaceae bacterium]MBT3808561.1 glycosyltransferase [Rhodospirillaceae bacterium]MBT3931119.1 glycosyltransferase [Rhodospirillaceae bacterium]MBT4773581.1 glycosyltransferase [Rhodospirillaceae bacterium]MBT5360001.1 glycosyltransferase [Rhodospirillaceae bacterium]
MPKPLQDYMPTLRLTFVIESLGGGGAQRVLALLTTALADLGQEVCVVTYAERGADRVTLDPRVMRRAADLGGESGNVFGAISMNIRRISGLRDLIRESRPDVVIAFVGTTNILTLLACSGLRVPVVISERNDPARQSLGRAWDVLRRLLYRRAAVVTANATAAVTAMAHYVPASKLSVIPNPLAVPVEINAPDAGDPYVLAVGRLHPQKGFDVLLEAFAVFVRSHPEWRMVLLGEGPERDRLTVLADELGIAERVSFAGFVDPTPFYRGCSMFVQPSRFEGSSNALLEAMGHACPIIVTGVPDAMPDFVSAGENARVVPTEDAPALTSAMGALATNPAVAQELGASAHQAVAKLSPDRIAGMWLDIFNGVAR